MKLSSALAGLSLTLASYLSPEGRLLHAENAITKAPATKASQGAASLPTVGSEAVIEHEYSSQINILLLIAALDVDGKTIKTREEADQLFASTEKSIAALAEEAPNQAVATTLTRDSARLMLYLLSNSVPGKEAERIGKASKWLETFSQRFADSSKKPDLKARALYFNALAKFFISDGGDGISSLVQLRPQLVADKGIAANIDLLLGYSLALSPGTAAQGFSYMAQATPSISVHGRVAQKLTEAYVESGLDADGNPTLAPKPTANDKIAYALQIVRGMPPALQHIVTNTAIYIWSHSKASNDAKPPQYFVDGFKDIIPVQALREREAIAQIKSKNFKAASELYGQIAQSLSNPALSLAVERRMWELDVAQFQKTGQIAELEKSYLAFREKHPAKKKPASPEMSAFIREVADTYRSTLDNLLTQALAPQAPAAGKTGTLQASVRYIEAESDRQSAYPLKLKVGQLYRSLNLYKEAVETFLDLAKDLPLKNLLLAIEAQAQLAKWPAQPTFEAPTAGSQEERGKLLSIYERLSKTKGGDEWFVIAHMGMLKRALGQGKSAEDLWLAYLNKNVNSKLALEASGLLLTEFNAAKRWQDFIDLSHLLQAKKTVPTSKYKTLAYQPWLGDALFNAAALDLQSKNYARSIKHNEEFAQGFASDSRVPQALYSSAFGYKSLNKLTPALTACRMVVERFPQSSLKPKVLLQAGEWASADRNAWEFAFFFYTKYLNEFKNEANVPQIRTTLAELYYKRKLYGWASRLYKEQSLAPNVPKAGQLQAAVKYLEIEERYGEPKDAYWGAQRIEQLASAKEPAYAKALAFQGRYIATSKNLKAMADMEEKLMPYMKTSKDIIEALASLRFHRAEILTQDIVYTENNLSIRDPEAMVKKYFDRYEAEKQHYLKVCQLGISSLCAPAFYRLTTVSEQGYEAVKKIEIAATLGATRTNSFKVFKQLHLSKIEQNHKGFIEQALKLSKQGTTTPLWRDEIAKSLEYEGAGKLAH